MSTTITIDPKKEMKMKMNQQLKHLGFVEVIAIKTLIWVSYLYDYAKQNSGSFKSGIQVVENAVSTVLTPVYSEFKQYPRNLLLFLDHKVDEAENKFDEHSSPMVKKVVSQAWSMTRKASQLTLTFISDIQAEGVFTAAKQLIQGLVSEVQAKTKSVAREVGQGKKAA